MNKVVYTPPPAHVLNAFSRDVCHRLAQQDAAFDDPEIVRGLTGFLSAVATAVANNLNRANGSVDNESEQV